MYEKDTYYNCNSKSKNKAGEKMKKICFVIGNNYSNIYESCMEFLSRNYLNDMLLLDFDKTLERIHYKSKVNIDYNKWYNILSEKEKSLLFSETVIPDIFFAEHLSQIPGDY